MAKGGDKLPRGKGGAKAMRAMRKTYGKKKGTSVFYAKKNKHAPGKSEAGYYKKGGRQK